MASALPQYIVFKTSPGESGGVKHLRRNDDGSFGFTERSVFSPEVKVEVEQAKINSRYFHLRFCHSNRYWRKQFSDKLVALDTKPEEDISKESCTLFEAVLSLAPFPTVRLNHVASGLAVYAGVNNVMFHATQDKYPIHFVDWSDLLKLPKNVAFKGDNGKYLLAYDMDGSKHLRFHSSDYNDEWSGHEVELMDDGYIRIKSKYWGKYWNVPWTQAVMVTTSLDADPKATDTLFWPTRIDKNTIALRSAVNNMFCRRRSWDDKTDTLIADVVGMTAETHLTVQELVAERKIYNVRYRVEDARIFDEEPYAAGTTYATNNSNVEMAIAVSLTYTDEKTFTVTNSLSVTTGVAVTFEGGLPGVATESIEINFSMTAGFEWGKQTRTATSITATGSVNVPARTRAAVRYVGTKGHCDIPFSYTYQDRSSVDGKIIENQSVDGFFTGVASYNFNFIVDRLIPL